MKAWLLVLLVATSAHASTLKIAAASDLRFALDEVAHEFERAHPDTHLEISYGASGRLTTQIESGAPFDLFLSADEGFADRLVKIGKSAGPAFHYARGHLALWSRNASSVNVERGITALKTASRVAIANPEQAPYGRLADQALERAGLKASLHLVFGENIAQTAQFAETGAADAGLISLSLAETPKLKAEGHYSRLDPKLDPGLVQAGVVLKSSPDLARFRSFFLGADGRRILGAHGLEAL